LAKSRKFGSPKRKKIHKYPIFLQKLFLHELEYKIR